MASLRSTVTRPPGCVRAPPRSSPTPDGENLIAGFPRNRISDRDRSAVEDLGERAAAPAFTHGCLQTGRRVLHKLARTRFAADAQPAYANTQYAPARVLEIDRRDHEVGAPRFVAE